MFLLGNSFKTFKLIMLLEAPESKSVLNDLLPTYKLKIGKP